MRIFASILILAAAALPEPVAGQTPRPEAYFGHWNTICALPETEGTKGTRDATVPAPAPAAAAQLINAYVAAVAAGANSDQFLDTARIPEKTRTSCAGALNTLLKSERCKSNPLYLLGDGEIRQAWLCGSRVTYQFFYTVDAGMIANIWSNDATKPVQVIGCPDRNRATGQAVWNGTQYVERCRS